MENFFFFLKTTRTKTSKKVGGCTLLYLIVYYISAHITHVWSSIITSSWTCFSIYFETPACGCISCLIIRFYWHLTSHTHTKEDVFSNFSCLSPRPFFQRTNAAPRLTLSDAPITGHHDHTHLIFYIKVIPNN